MKTKTPAFCKGKNLKGAISELNVLMLCPDYKPNFGGEAEVAYCLAVELRKLGYIVTVLAPNCPEEVPEDTNLPDAVIRQLDLGRFVPLNRIRGWLTWPVAMRGMLESVRRVVLEKSPDICFVTSYMTWVILALWKLNVPYALFLHGEDITLMAARGGLSKRIFLRACKRAKWIFINSGHSRKLLGGLSVDLLKKSESVGCGVRTKVHWTTDRRDEARRALGWSKGPTVVTVAKLIMRKGIDTVIRAIPKILEKYPDFRYVLVGDGPDRHQLEAIAKQIGVTEHVLMMGHVDLDTKQQIYSASDVYIMVSYPGVQGEEEGFGITFLEANLHGLPVIGSQCGGIPESVEHEGSGLLVEPHQPEKVAEAIDRLLSDPELCRQMVEHGRRRIDTQFNWPTIATRIGPRLAEIVVRR
ncbi:MAG: glycosyltransferase family 4 protein [Candidatus Hodarchaeota archaeon]